MAPHLRRSVFQHPFAIACGAASLLFLGLCLLLVSAKPSVSVRPSPTAQTIQAARDVIDQVRVAGDAGGPGALVRLDNRMLDGMAALAADMSGETRVHASIHAGVLTLQLSVPLPGDWWLNVSAKVSGEHQGFPSPKLRAGRISLPQFGGRSIAELARWIAQAEGTNLPPLDEMVRALRVDREHLTVAIRLPEKASMVDALMTTGGSGADARQVSDIYCRLVTAHRADPVTQLPLLIRRAFSNAPSLETANYNRAAFVALAVYVVGDRAQALAPTAAPRIATCGRVTDPMLLQQRHDLAMHWTFSAALQAVVGGDRATALGEWKELGDSLPSGTGFSFVDLAADRSGMRTARLGVDESSAHATSDALAEATEEDLLPARLLRGREGVSDTAFVGRFGTIEAKEYQAVVAWIDRELSRSQSKTAR